VFNILLFILPVGLIISAIVVLFIAIFFIRFFKPGEVHEKDINKDLISFREELDQKADELIHWSDEDLKLLTLNLSEYKKQGRKHTIERGVIKNIYHEPTIAYVVKHYNGKKPRTLLVIRTKDFEMVWLRNDKGITVYKNGKQFANLLRDGRLLDADGKKMLGFLKHDKQMGLNLYIDDKLSAQVLMNHEPTALHKRALDIYIDTLERDKEKILAMSMLDIVESSKKS